MTCQQCIDEWGTEPSAWGDSMLELTAYFKHLVIHLGQTDTVVPPGCYWGDDDE